MHRRVLRGLRKAKEVFDWRFWGSFAIFLLVVLLFYGAIRNNRQRDELISAAQHAAAQVEHLQQQQAEQSAEAAKRASTLRRENRQLQLEVRGLVAFLKEQGLAVPGVVLDSSSAPGSVASSSKTTHAHKTTKTRVKTRTRTHHTPKAAGPDNLTSRVLRSIDQLLNELQLVQVPAP